MTLVPVDTSTHCPRCAHPVHVETVHQPALVYFGGHGATLRTVERSCPCGWAITTETGEVRP